MPWVYFDMESPGKGKLTDDESNEIGIVTHLQIETTRDSPLAPMMTLCEISIAITDYEGFIRSLGFDKKPA